MKQRTPSKAPPSNADRGSDAIRSPAPQSQGPLNEGQDLVGNQAMLGLLRDQGRGPDSPAPSEATELPHRQEMEAAFGEDLSGVEAFAGPESAAMSGGIGAQAFALVDQIVFGQPNPSKETVAHEVAHVVQQRRHGGATSAAGTSSVGDASEREASSVAKAAAAGQPVQVDAAPSAGVHREAVTAPFSDLANEADWVIQAVNQAYDLGLVKGYGDGSGTFGAGNVLTQPEFLTMIFRAKGAEPPWEQVMEEGRAVGAVLDDDWSRALTRGEAARIICKIYGLGQGDIGAHFTDTSGELGGYLEKLGDFAVFRGDGNAGSVRPDAALNRAEAAALAVRVCGVGGTMINEAEQNGGDDGKVRVPTSSDSSDDKVRVPTADDSSQSSAGSPGVSVGATAEQAASGHAQEAEETIHGMSALEYTALVTKYSEKTVDFYLEHIHGTDPRANQALVEVYEGVTGIRDTVNTAIAVKDTVEAIDDLYDATTPAESLEAYSRFYNAVEGLIPGIPGVSSFLELYGDALEQIAGKVSEISQTIYQGDMVGAAELSISTLLEVGGHTGTWPGGAEMAEHMVQLMNGSGPISVKGKDDVINWVVQNSEQLAWLTGEAPPATEGFIFDSVDEDALAIWLDDHRETVWQVLYGDAKV